MVHSGGVKLDIFGWSLPWQDHHPSPPRPTCAPCSPATWVMPTTTNDERRALKYEHKWIALQQQQHGRSQLWRLTDKLKKQQLKLSSSSTERTKKQTFCIWKSGSRVPHLRKKHLQIDFSVSIVRYTLCRNVCWSTILANLDLNRATNLN